MGRAEKRKRTLFSEVNDDAPCSSSIRYEAATKIPQIEDYGVRQGIQDIRPKTILLILSFTISSRQSLLEDLKYSPVLAVVPLTMTTLSLNPSTPP